MAKQTHVLIDGAWIPIGGMPGKTGDTGDKGDKGDTGERGVEGPPGGGLSKTYADNYYESKSELLKEAAWWVDAGAVNAGKTQLDDLTGRGRPAVFGAAAAAPVVLPWSGEDYLRVHVGEYLLASQATLTIPAVSTITWDCTHPAGALTWALVASANGGVQIELTDTSVAVGFYEGGVLNKMTWAGVTVAGTRAKCSVALTATGATLTVNGVSQGAKVAGVTRTPATQNKNPWQTLTASSHLYSMYIDATHSIEPRNVSADYSTIANTGSAGGNWTIIRAATGYKAAVVDRPLLLFGGVQNTTAMMPSIKNGTMLYACRTFSDSAAHYLWNSSSAGINGLHAYTGSSTSLVRSMVNVGADQTTRADIPASTYGQHVFGAALSASTFTGIRDGSVVATDSAINAAAVLIYDRFMLGYPGLSASMEFIAAAIWDRALTDAEIAEVSLDLAGVPHEKQPDPHPQYVLESKVGNLLTENQASGTDTLGDSTGFTSAGCTLTSEVSGAYQGSKFLRATWTSGSGQVYSGGSSTSGTIPVEPGQQYTVQAMMKSTNLTTVTYVTVYWWTAAGNVSAGTAGITPPSSFVLSSAWKQTSGTFTAPAGAAFCSIRWVTGGFSAAGEISLDALGFWKGAGGNWAMPGTPITGTQSSMEQVALLADLPSTNNWLGRKIQVTSGLGFQVMMWNGTAWVVAPESDTGSRSVTLINGWAGVATPGYYTVQRIGNVIYLNLYSTASNATAVTLWVPPAGFLPHSQQITGGTWKGVSVGGNPGLFEITPAGVKAWAPGGSAVPNSSTVVISSSWRTYDPWPTAAPA